MSFTQGLSGLQAASQDLDVIGNNVANVDTVGFKSSQAQFSDVFAASLGGAGSSQIGIGTKLATVAQQFTQGSITTTNNPLDMAINGPGFFIVHGVNGTGYSRNGQFQVDKNGNIVTSTGENLQGWPAVGGVVANGGPTSNLQISTNPIPPVQTNSITVGGLNLDSRSNATPPTSVFNPKSGPYDPSTNPTGTYNYSTSTTVYDSLGNARMDTMYFQLASPAVGSVAGATTAAEAAGNINTVASTAGLAVGEQVLDTTTGNSSTITSVAADGVTFTTLAALTAGTGDTLQFGPQAATSGATGSNVVTLTPPDVTAGLVVGQSVTGDYPPGTTIATIDPASNSFTTSQGALNGTGAAITFGAVGADTTWNVYTTLADPNTPGTYLYPAGPLPTTAATSWAPIGTMTFDPVTGNLTNTTSPLGAAQADQIELPSTSLPPQFAKGITFVFSGATQYGASSSAISTQPNGSTTGNLVGYSASANGQITANYSNNTTQLLGQVALATFSNNQGLQSIGNNEWAATTASGAPNFNPPGVGINGVLQTASVEGSNVDLTTELVKMITAQRNYQANSQTIKTQETVMQTLINMR
jgi:flagellar hook protein FlgE